MGIMQEMRTHVDILVWRKTSKQTVERIYFQTKVFVMSFVLFPTQIDFKMMESWVQNAQHCVCGK